MNQRELSFLYRGVFLFVLGGIPLALLSSSHQPWARNAETIGTALWVLGLAAFIGIVTFRGFGQFLNTPGGDEPLPPDLYPPFLFHLARLAVAASVFLALVLVMVFLFVASPEQCPDWYLPGKHPTPLWLLFLMFTVPILAGLSFIVARWNWCLRKAIASVDYPTTIPISYTIILPVFLGCAMSQFPWVLLVTKCWMGS